MIMRRVVNQRGFHLDLALAQVAGDAVECQLFPQPGRGHDLIKLLQFAEAGDVALAFGLFGPGDRETAGAGEGRILGQPLVDVFRLGRLSGEGRAEEAIKHREETFGRPANEPQRRDAGHDFVRSDHDQPSGWLRPLVECRDVVIERGTFQEGALCGLRLRFGIGRRRVFFSLDAAFFLLHVEGEQLFVIVRGRDLEVVVIERLEDVEPDDVNLVLQKQVVGFDEVNQRDLAGVRNECYHRCVLRAWNEEAFDCFLVRCGRTFLLRHGEVFFCKSGRS